MAPESRIRIVFASVLGCLLLLLPGAPGAGEQQLGRILYSSSTSLRGVPVPKSETIFSGDVLVTSGGGSALVELQSGAKVKITENTSVRFLRDGEKVQAELLSGVVVSESAGKPAIVVTTPKYRFTPSQEGDCRYLVRLSKEQETIAAAVKGNLLINTHDSSGRYILHEGKYAAIPASSVGVPAQEKQGDEQAPAEQAPAEQAPTGQAPAEQAPTGQAPAEQAPTGQAPTEKPPVEQAPTGQAPTEKPPVEQAPAEKLPAEQAPAGQAGTVSNAIPEEAVQHLGKGEWTPLKVNDAINWADVVSTSKGGRVRIALLGGSFLNVGAHSVMKVTRHDPQTQQTQVELNEGRMRAEVVELTDPNAAFHVETPTATIGVVSGLANTVFLVEADPKETRVDCVRGLVTAGNRKRTLTERVRLHPGQFTIVTAEQHPTLPNEVSPPQLQGRINQTDVGDSTIRATVPGRPGAAVKEPWHIGSLSPGGSIALLAGGAAAVAAIPLAAGGGSVSPTVP
ncbi:MAG: FecR domain-containing protein [Acidobacteriia bacterium]|nr:FecR domain-containing protein [Terriglobia bacterium]